MLSPACFSWFAQLLVLYNLVAQGGTTHSGLDLQRQSSVKKMCHRPPCRPPYGDISHLSFLSPGDPSFGQVEDKQTNKNYQNTWSEVRAGFSHNTHHLRPRQSSAGLYAPCLFLSHLINPNCEPLQSPLLRNWSTSR